MKKRIKTLITISIMANVLLAGALAGIILDRPQDMPWEKMKQDLSPEAQKLVTEMFLNTWKDSGPVIRQAVDNRKYLADVVRADKFDPAKFDEAVKRVRGTQDLITKKKIESTKELLTKLPDEDRKKIADQVANSFSHKGAREGKRPHDYPRPPGEDGKMMAPAPSPSDEEKP